MSILSAPALPTSLPPSGVAGGDLDGTFPNPTLDAIIAATGPLGGATVAPIITVDTKGRVTALTSTTIAGVAPGGAAGGALGGTYPNPSVDMDVLTTKGDLLTQSADGTYSRLAVGGSLLQRLAVVAGVPAWLAAFVVRTGDASLSSQPTPQSDDTLLFAIAANEVWLAEAILLFNAANTTMDVKTAWAVPAGCTMLWGKTSVFTTTDAGFTPYTTATTATVLLSESGTLSFGSNNGTFGAALTAFVLNGATAGNVNFQWSQNTSDVGTLKLLKGSLLRLTRLI